MSKISASLPLSSSLTLTLTLSLSQTHTISLSLSLSHTHTHTHTHAECTMFWNKFKGGSFEDPIYQVSVTLKIIFLLSQNQLKNIESTNNDSKISNTRDNNRNNRSNNGTKNNYRLNPTSRWCWYSKMIRTCCSFKAYKLGCFKAHLYWSPFKFHLIKFKLVHPLSSRKSIFLTYLTHSMASELL